MERSEKKSNKRIIAIAALLLALIILFAFGGYTMSKYISSKSVTGSAQVAKWGYTVTVKADDFFGEQYKTGKIETNTSATGIDVKAGGDYKVVAPGTEGSMTFGIAGTAEVLAKVSIKMDELTAGAGVKDVQLKANLYADKTKSDTAQAVTYSPIKWTLKKGSSTTTDWTTVSAYTGCDGVALSAIETALEAMYSTNMEPNATTAIDDVYQLSWKWGWDNTGALFTVTGSDSNPDSTLTQNNGDTILGAIANHTGTGAAEGEIGGGTALTYFVDDSSVTQIAFKLSITVEQVRTPASAT